MVLLIYFLLYIVYNIHIYIKCDGDFMDIELKENERIDDLEYRGLKIIQNKNGFCFGIDSVLISDLLPERQKQKRYMEWKYKIM